MKLLLLTFGFGVISAIIPIFNMEAYISVVYASTDHRVPLLIAFIGSLGQNIGKLVWYYVSRGALRHPLAQAAAGHPQAAGAASSGGAATSQGRPVMSGLLTFVSAAIGFPPFFAMAMVAGTLRMNVVVFFVAGLLGRTLFFWAWLLGVGLIFH